MLGEERKPRFLSLNTINIWGWIILCHGGCLMHCWAFSSIPGFYSLEACGKTSLHRWDNQNHLQTLPSVLSRQHQPQLRTTEPGTDTWVGGGCFLYLRAYQSQNYCHFGLDNYSL